MADSRDLRMAREASALILSPVEEQIVLDFLTKTENRIAEFLNNPEGQKEAREPYEFN